jgi:hypothetical protein
MVAHHVAQQQSELIGQIVISKLTTEIIMANTRLQMLE